MKYLKYLQTANDFESFKNSEDYVLPNVSYVVETEGVSFEPYVPLPPSKVGDIAYWDGSTVKTVSLDNWNVSLSTPVGVVAVPTGFAPDGKVRIIGLKPVDSNGNLSTSHVAMEWGLYGTNTSLTNYNRVPTTDNAGSTSTGSSSFGYLPSDKFTSSRSYVDTLARYNNYNPMIPSPYLGDEPNPEYYKEISGYNNALSDFNGLANTQLLVGLSSDYVAANAAYKYTDGSSNLQWYLPAMGELGYVIPRFNMINASLTAVGGVAIGDSDNFWSSSEYDRCCACRFNSREGEVGDYYKNYTCYVRPFAVLA